MACRMWKGHEWGKRACLSGELGSRNGGISKVGNHEQLSVLY